MIGWSGWRSAIQSAAQTIAQLVGQDIVARSISLTGTGAGIVSNAGRYTSTSTTGPAYTSTVNSGQYAFFDTNANGGIASAVNSMTFQAAGGAQMTVGSGVITLASATALSFSSFSDGSASPGNATNNNVRGKNAIAAGASAVTITNSFVAASSTVLCVLETVDGTLLYLRTVVPGAGSFVVTGNANATGNVVFSFIVLK